MVLVLAFGLALVTGVVFGDVPAWFATRTDPMGALRQSGCSACNGSSFIRTGAACRAGDLVDRVRGGAGSHNLRLEDVVG